MVEDYKEGEPFIRETIVEDPELQDLLRHIKIRVRDIVGHLDTFPLFVLYFH